MYVRGEGPEARGGDETNKNTGSGDVEGAAS